jgi:hypothetical protein
MGQNSTEADPVASADDGQVENKADESKCRLPVRLPQTFPDISVADVKTMCSTTKFKQWFFYSTASVTGGYSFLLENPLKYQQFLQEHKSNALSIFTGVGSEIIISSSFNRAVAQRKNKSCNL